MTYTRDPEIGSDLIVELHPRRAHGPWHRMAGCLVPGTRTHFDLAAGSFEIHERDWLLRRRVRHFRIADFVAVRSHTFSTDPQIRFFHRVELVRAADRRVLPLAYFPPRRRTRPWFQWTPLHSEHPDAATLRILVAGRLGLRDLGYVETRGYPGRSL